MKERPILFNTPMVQAILAGRKTQTRRLIKSQPLWIGEQNIPFKTDSANHKGIINCPYGNVKDRLWVRETTELDEDNGPDYIFLSRYVADKKPVLYSGCGDSEFNGSVAHWDYPTPVRPSIHMRRWESRITLEITDLEVERIQDISAEDAIAEGLKYCPNATGGNGWVMPGSGYDLAGLCYSMPETAFHRGIDEIYPGILGANPWVWAISFKVLEVRR